jgi:pyruvate formate lyase activating enzyme
MIKDKNKGLVFNIQRFSIHDGPGIRTTVFMKGCPLRCFWCSNPESQDFFPNLMVRDINCKGCGACVKVCPRGAITMILAEGRKIDWSLCNHCLLCVGACIYQSLNRCGSYMDFPDIVLEIMKDEDFYRNSGGGMTVSGGEALCQSEGVAHLLELCKREGLHTALDTTGYASWEKLASVLEFTDMVLFDVKHLDPDEHRRVTGVGNEGILENLEKAAKKKRTWIRMPLIAGFNDSETHIRQMTALAKRIGAERMSLLPYHEGGKAKSRQLGRVYPCPDASAPAEDHVHRLKDIVEGEGMKVTVGS